LTNLERKTIARFHRIVLPLAVLILCAGCTKKPAESASTKVELTGAGSTFIYPMMSKWASEYQKIHPDFSVNYQSIGSGGGIRQISEGTVDFGATDGPMSDELLAASKTGKLLHIPVAMGADVPAYNVPGVSTELKFTPTVLANIFLGKINNWNDPQIGQANPGAQLPNLPLVVIHRADGSGTTYIWTDYLSKVSPEWKTKVGTNTSVGWPVGIGAKGNEGVAGQILQTSGAIGYVELIYAEHNHLPFGSVQNADGNFIKASPASVSAAAASAEIPEDFRYSITNALGKDAYPISGTTWLLIPLRPRDAARGKVVVSFADWILGDGQELAPTLDYAKIPANISTRARQALLQVH
jgi:phosphate transport system substrate-binding protein